jgi:DNA-binding PadR family transcriptional regulator
MLPKLTHLQYAILHVLKSEDKSGEVIRKALGLYSQPAFYQLMKRMETGGYIKGEYVLSPRKRERYYSVTPAGLVELKCVRAFYKAMESK